MTRPRPRVSTIPSGVSFVDALAQSLLQRAETPFGLGETTILLPTRRACRTLQEAFLRASGGRALLLPRLLPLGDLDAEELLLTAEESLAASMPEGALPPAMPALTRRLLLTRAILAWSRAAGRPQAPAEDQAARLAAELARLLDQVETEGLGFDRLAELVPDSYAVHWQHTLDFLKILTEHWPAIQAAEGGIGPAERRRRLHTLQAETWRAKPPAHPVIAAGSTGSIPSTAELLAVVAALPRGEVVLPGLDRSADEATWQAIESDPAHPQHGLARLLQRLELSREEVADWPLAGLEASPPLRGRLVELALRPAPATADWGAALAEIEPEQVAEAFAAVERIDCPGPGEEATAIALLLRQALEDDGRTAALITPDRRLARRVAAELRRWRIEIDDSAGRPLAQTPPGQFLRLTAALAETGCAPVPLLACLKHPLAAGGEAPAAFRAKVRRLELAVLRGPRPAPGFGGLRDALARDERASAALGDWLTQLAELAEPFLQAIAAKRSRLADALAAHVAFAEALAGSDRETGAERLWAGEAGEGAAGFVADLHAACLGADAGAGIGELGAGRYPGLLDNLLADQVVRPRYGRHPRVAVLGPLEARLHHADLVVLGGLNEGTWPAESDPGPWLSRPMRAAFGLPPVERRIGLSAHDFCQALGARQVVLTRASRVEGTPCVTSRWLRRLDALCQAAGRREAIVDASAKWGDWAAALDRPDGDPQPCSPPAPRPPLAARPTRLSVTRIETWMRDPYALYAREILRLRPLDPIDADPGAAERGILVHAALERFVKRFPDRLPEDALAQLLKIGDETFRAVAGKPGLYAFWAPRFRRIAAWVVAEERARRGAISEIFAEAEGALELEGFTLIAHADRIERLVDGRLNVLDYKTGQPPSKRDIALGLAPQLPLEAAMLRAGAFVGIPAGEPAGLEFWRLSGGEPAGESRPLVGGGLPEPATLAEDALAGLLALIARFAEPESAYHALPRPAHAPAYSDYAHLARVKEWASFTGGGS
jgi:ATP-dependent helicase/nuclease subunit B